MRFALVLTAIMLLCHTTLASAGAAPTLRWKLLRSIPRASGHFTEGLAFAGEQLYESTGRYGQSRLIAYDSQGLTQRAETTLPADRFGEGLTALGDTLFQLTWHNRELRRYNKQLQLQSVIPFDGEGWGLTTDGRQLLCSDGSSSLTFREPDKATVLRRITVHQADGTLRDNLNELEWVNGWILANVWHRDEVLVIDAQDGLVKGRYDFSKLAQQAGKLMPGRNGEQVLNGLAWNPATQTLLVTGKDWPLWFELKLLDLP